MRNSKALAAMAVTGVVAGSLACSGLSEMASDKAAEAITGQLLGEDVEIDRKSGTVTRRDAEGNEFVTGQGTDIPPDFPVTVGGNWKPITTVRTREGTMVAFEVPGDIDSEIQSIRRELAQLGCDDPNTVQIGPMSNFNCDNVEGYTMVNVSILGDGRGASKLSIQYRAADD